MRSSSIKAVVALVCIVSPALATPAQDQQRVEAIPELDPQRYAGTWYEIARFPNRFQDDCAGEVTATYRLRDDGRIDVVNACNQANGERKSAEGIAKKASDDGPYSKLKVRFAPGFLTWLPFVWGDYWVLALDDAYTRVAVGSPSREYLWILSRTPALAESDYRALVDEVAAMGFPVERLERTRQNHEGQ